MATLHLLLTQHDDYLSEYPRFFYGNYRALTSRGIWLPWLDSHVPPGRSVIPFSRMFDAIKAAVKEENGPCAGRSPGNGHMVLAGPVGWALELPSLLKKLGECDSTWKNPHIHCLWLATPKSHEIEGAYRKDPTEHTKQALYAQLERDPGEWLGNLESVLALADTLVVYPNTQWNTAGTAKILQGLALPVSPAELAAVTDLRLRHRDLHWLFTQFGSVLPPADEEFADALRAIDSGELHTFLEPARLEEFDARYNGPMLELAAKYGAPASFGDALKISPGWAPFQKPDIATLEALSRQMLTAVPTGESSLPRRIFAAAVPTVLPEFKNLQLPLQAPPVLSVLTLSYNQEKYIGECLESVLSQKTDFPVQHIVVDDGSSDATADIILGYARKYSRIVPIFLKRPRRAGENVRLLFSACRSPYAALCDGDDYFTDPLKLQKQVDFLKANPHCSICFHPVDVVYEDGRESRIYPTPDMLTRPAGENYTLRDLLRANLMQTNSVVYRWRFAEGLPVWFKPDLVPGDWYWHVLHAEKGDIGFLPERMAAYRRHAASLYASAEVHHTSHRLIHGMRELEVYDTLDRHFRRKLHKEFSGLADGVFADLTSYYAETGDDGPLIRACESWPMLGRDFLNKLKLA